MEINIKPCKISTSFKTEKIYPKLEELEVTPSVEEQKYKGAYGIVTVRGVTAEIDDNIKKEYIKEGVDILGVVGGYKGVDTSDATATPEDILAGKTAYANNEKIEGTIQEYDGSFEGNTSEEITISDASYLFYSGSRSNQIEELLKICKNVTKVISMFAYNKDITTLDLSNLDISNVTSMNYMLQGCDNLLDINLTNFNTSNVTSMDSLFANDKKIKELNLKNFDTSKVTSMYHMFEECNSVVDLDLSNFNTSNVARMPYMFYRLYKATNINVSSFNTSNVTNMEHMFCQCSVLENLDISNFDASNVENVRNMLYQCNNLINLKFMKNLGKGYTKTQNNYSNYNVHLSYTKALSHESLMDVINNLYDLNLTYDVANGGTLYTQSLTLGSTNLAKLTAEEIAIATNKGWTVS